MLKNNVEVDVKEKCIEVSVTQAKLAEEIGTSAPYVSRLIRNNDKIVNNTFLQLMEKLGYDVELTYVKKGDGVMASSKEYLDFILEQLSELDDVTYHAMMGEYIIYYRGKIVGGIYDDRFLVKLTKSAAAMMPDADRELPYEGAKKMLLVDNVENKEFLRELLEAMYEELPAPKKKK